MERKSRENCSKETKCATLEEIACLIGEVENSKQIHLSPQEFGCLQYDLYRLNEPIEKLRIRAEAVKRNPDYGRISLDVWLKSEPLYTSEEVNMLVSEKISQRKREYEELMQRELNEEELAKKGLIEVQIIWQKRLREQLEKHIKRIESKCKLLRAQFYKLPEQAKIDLWNKAVQKGLVKDGDPNAYLILPMLVPQMITEFEEAIKNNSIIKQKGVKNEQ